MPILKSFKKVCGVCYAVCATAMQVLAGRGRGNEMGFQTDYVQKGLLAWVGGTRND